MVLLIMTAYIVISLVVARLLFTRLARQGNHDIIANEEKRAIGTFVTMLSGVFWPITVTFYGVTFIIQGGARRYITQLERDEDLKKQVRAETNAKIALWEQISESGTEDEKEVANQVIKDLSDTLRE